MTAKITLADRSAAMRKLIGLAGGIKPLADKVGLKPSSVAGWIDVPIKHVIRIEGLFPGQITRQEMAPEYFAEKP